MSLFCVNILCHYFKHGHCFVLLFITQNRKGTLRIHIIFKSRLIIPTWSQKNHYSGFLLLTELDWLIKALSRRAARCSSWSGIHFRNKIQTSDSNNHEPDDVCGELVVPQPLGGGRARSRRRGRACNVARSSF